MTIDPRPPDGDAAGQRKARGAFFTPPALCGYLARWAVRDAGDQVLEPSCGEAAFLLALAERLQQLAAGRDRARDAGSAAGVSPVAEVPAAVGPGSLDGVELHRASAVQARSVLAAAGLTARVRVADFLELEPDPVYDAVVGNPPYVRYQDFSGEARTRGRRAALRAGVRLTNLASSWAAFTVHAALFLRPGGRLALVLPAELLSVNYAAQVREFLMRRFSRVRLVLFTERVFPGVLEEVVLLLAEGTGPTDHCELVQVRDVEELLAVGGEQAGAGTGVSRWRPDSALGKWTPAMIPSDALDAYAAAVGHPGLATLHAWGETTLGAVTGNNGFFALSPQQAARLGLDPGRDLLPLSPPGSRHLRGLALTGPGWRALGEHGRATWLFRPEATPSRAAQAYLRAGRAEGVDAAYKCRVRSPWWRVPIVPPADLLLTYMNADTPRLTGNPARVHHLNSVHGVYLRPGLRRTGSRLLPLASLNSITLLGAETVGRSYGGGILKLEPREADLLPVPGPAAVTAAAAELLRIRASVAGDLAAGRLLDAVARVDRVLLVDVLGLDPVAVARLAAARAVLADRRAARSSGRRTGSRERGRLPAAGP